MTYGYIRVSTDKQTVENQRFEINKFCESEHIQVDGWIEETISGTKAYNKRELGKLVGGHHHSVALLIEDRLVLLVNERYTAVGVAVESDLLVILVTVMLHALLGCGGCACEVEEICINRQATVRQY